MRGDISMLTSREKKYVFVWTPIVYGKGELKTKSFVRKT